MCLCSKQPCPGGCIIKTFFLTWFYIKILVLTSGWMKRKNNQMFACVWENKIICVRLNQQFFSYVIKVQQKLQINNKMCYILCAVTLGAHQLTEENTCSSGTVDKPQINFKHRKYLPGWDLMTRKSENFTVFKDDFVWI